ncbi:MAG: MerR family transcriptional regulator [Clostridiales bacterium]|nr:MerR family transcriptional regulator [Clostridiales bacterium]
MINEKHTLFTIGQFAKLHGINKKTLMWYDETGLLKPACIKENGYRYYTYHQSSVLETILMLRELDVSVKEISLFMSSRSAGHLEQLLTEKIEELDDTITHMKAVRRALENHRQEMHTLQHMDLTEISIVQKEKRYLATVPVTPELPFEKQIEKVIEETKKYQLRRLHDASYGSIIPVEHLLQGDFSDYTGLFIEIPNPVQKKGLHIQPAGSYLRAFCKGSWDQLPECYQRILSYAKQNRLTLFGNAYEKGINEIVIESPEEYITQIEIPVKSIPS